MKFETYLLCIKVNQNILCSSMEVELNWIFLYNNFYASALENKNFEMSGGFCFENIKFLSIQIGTLKCAS